MHNSPTNVHYFYVAVKRENVKVSWQNPTKRHALGQVTRSSHKLGKFLLHFLLDVCVVLHLGEQSFGGGKISWWGRELDVKKTVSHRAARRNSFITDHKSTLEGAGGGGMRECFSMRRLGRIPLSRAASIRFVKSVSFPASERQTCLSSTNRKLKENQSSLLC